MKPLVLLALLTLTIPRLAHEWRFAHTPPRATPPVDAAWQEEFETDGRGDLWMRAPLPRDVRAGTHLVFRAYVDELTIFVDATPIYTFRDPSRDGKLTLHDVALPAGRSIYIRVPHTRQPAVFGAAPFLATPDLVPVALERIANESMRESTFNVVIGIVLMLIGVVSAAAALLRRRGDARMLLGFGTFTFLYGLRLLLDSFLPIVFGVPLRTIELAQALITYVIPIPAWALTTRLIGRGWKSSLWLQVIAFAIFAPIGIASDFVTGRPGSVEWVNNILVIVGGLNIVANTIRSRRRATLELRVVIAGALLFLLFALNNNLAALGVLPWPSGNEALGFLVFVACLGFAAVRAFLRGERESIALENELRTAREIQQSILPTRMPEVAGLRVEARYEPASSVAGDLYDFLRVDAQHLGVLVADVSGHGVPAAIVASMVKTAATSQARLAHEPAALLEELDRTLRRDVKRSFVTATCLWLDLNTRTVTVSNAGHPPPLLIRNDSFRELGASGPLLGRFASALYTAATTEIASGDRIIAYTDGIVEARNAKREPFGEERLRALARTATADEIVTAVRAWRADDGDADDLTVVVIAIVDSVI